VTAEEPDEPEERKTKSKRTTRSRSRSPSPAARQTTPTPTSETESEPSSKGAAKGAGAKKAPKGAGKGGKAPAFKPPPKGKGKGAETPQKAPLSCTQLGCFKGIYEHSGLQAALENARGMRGYVPVGADPGAVAGEVKTLGELCETVVDEFAGALRVLALRTLDFDPSSADSWEAALKRLVGQISDIKSSTARDEVARVVESRNPTELVEALRAGPAGKSPLKRDVEESVQILGPALARLSQREPVLQTRDLPAPDVVLSGPEREYVYRLVRGVRIPSAVDIARVLKAAFAERSSGCVGQYLKSLARANAKTSQRSAKKKTPVELQAEEALERLVPGKGIPKAQQGLVFALKKMGSAEALGGALGAVGRELSSCARRSEHHGDAAFRRVLEGLGGILERARGAQPPSAVDSLLLWSNVLGADIGPRMLSPEDNVALALRSRGGLRHAEDGAKAAVAVANRLGGVPGSREVSVAEVEEAARFLRVLQDVHDKAVGPGVLGVCRHGAVPPVVRRSSHHEPTRKSATSAPKRLRALSAGR
jgi:hypothetical protein